MKEARDLESKLKDTLKESSEKFKCSLSEDVQEVVQQMYDFDASKEHLKDLGLDVTKLPIGKLSQEKINRAHQLLREIQRLLVTEDKKKETMLVPLSNDFYATIPHDFGMKKPPIIDHLLRVKEKTRLLE